MGKTAKDKKPVEAEPDEKTIVKEFCSPSCYIAKNSRCKCHCEGKYHGKGIKKAKGEKEKSSFRVKDVRELEDQ